MGDLTHSGRFYLNIFAIKNFEKRKFHSEKELFTLDLFQTERK